MADLCLFDIWERDDHLLKPFQSELDLDYLMDDNQSWDENTLCRSPLSCSLDGSIIESHIDDLQSEISSPSPHAAEPESSSKSSPLETRKSPPRITKITLKGAPLILPFKNLKNIRAIRVLESKTESKDEERRLARKEGISFPTHYPLTKDEEGELKRLRRKIRNKQSAQDSRKRKKKYIDGLEEKVKQCSTENLTLQQKLQELQRENQNLIAQLKRLQTLAKGANKGTQTSTCLLVLMLSISLLLLPNMRQTGDDAPELDPADRSGGDTTRSRTLLSRTDFPHSSFLVDEGLQYDSDPQPYFKEKIQYPTNKSLLGTPKAVPSAQKVGGDVPRPPGMKTKNIEHTMVIGNRTVMLQVPHDIDTSRVQ